MSATLPLIEPATVLPVPTPHTMVLGNTRFWCIQDDCDLVHHWWCSCEHARAHAY